MADKIDDKKIGSTLQDPNLYSTFRSKGGYGFDDGAYRVETPRRRKKGDMLVHKRYEVLDVAGAGGMGVVYKSRKVSTKETVALKTILSGGRMSKEDEAQFEANYQLVKKLAHPNIVNVYAKEIDEYGQWYLEMDWIEGEELSDFLRRLEGDRRLLTTAVITKLHDVAVALDEAHKQGVIHRDVKETNIMIVNNVGKNEEKPKTILIDFGIASREFRQTTTAGDGQCEAEEVLVDFDSGTPEYQSPEQWEGIRPVNASDEYSLAVTAYKCLSGHFPFESKDGNRSSLRELVLDKKRKVPVIHGISKQANAVLRKALSLEPEKRYDSCVEFIDKLDEALNTASPSPWRRMAAAAGLCLLCLAAVVFWPKPQVKSSDGTNVESEWITRQSELQEAATAERKKAQKDRDDHADVIRQYAASAYQDALSQLDEGERQFNAGEFEKAKTAFVAATKGFAKARKTAGDELVNRFNQAVQGGQFQQADDMMAELDKLGIPNIRDLKITRLLAEAKKALSDKKWHVVIDRTEAVLKIDSGHAEAKTIKDQVESECYAQKVELENFNKKWDNGANLDKGQTFGVHWEIFDREYRKGLEALKNKNFGLALKFFGDAQVESEWITSRTELRKAAKPEYDKAKTGRDDHADIIRQYAADAYQDALNQLDEGERQFNAGEFEKAKTAFVAATKGFAKARKTVVDDWRNKFDQAVQGGQFPQADDMIAKLDKLGVPGIRDLKITRLLAEARKASSNKKWDAAIDNAKAVLEIASNHAEAQKIRKQAEDELIPRMKVVATLGGEDVPASWEYNGKTCQMPFTFQTLEKGQRLAGRLTYRCDGSEYVGEIDEVVDWTGLKTVAVPLKIVSFGGTVILPGGVKMELVKVEKGSFTMGNSSFGYAGDRTQHTTQLTKDFWIGKTEVTQSQYAAIMEAEGGVRNEQGELCKPRPSDFEGDFLPVEQVSWYDSMAFCKALTERERAAGRLPDGYEYTLPTEAQWEFAARGGNHSKNYQYSGSDNLDEVGWLGGNSGKLKLNKESISYEDVASNECKTHLVGLKKANELGIFDMSGNVEEWCLDSCDYNRENHSIMTDTYKDGIVNPLCKVGSKRIVRGGSWLDDAVFSNSSRRWHDEPKQKRSMIGFRVVLSAVQRN